MKKYHPQRFCLITQYKFSCSVLLKSYFLISRKETKSLLSYFILFYFTIISKRNIVISFQQILLVSNALFMPPKALYTLCYSPRSCEPLFSAYRNTDLTLYLTPCFFAYYTIFAVLSEDSTNYSAPLHHHVLF